MKGYIYITTNLINNKQYIGKRVDTEFRHWYFGSGIHLKNAVKKYGKENFKVELLEATDELEKLNQMEIDYIAKYNAVENNNFYNIHPGGTGFMWGEYSHMKKPEYKKLFSQLTKGENNGMYRSGERGIHPKGFKGHKHNEKTKKIQSETMKRVNDLGLNTNWKNGHPKGMLNKHHNEQSKEKIGKGKVEIIFVNGEKRQYPSLTTASKETNIPRTILDKALKTNKPYQAPNNFKKKYAHFNGLIVKMADNTEITK